MDQKQSKVRLLLSIAGKAVFVVLVLYLGCYHLRSAILVEGNTKVRVYGTAAEARVFSPLAKIESFLFDQRVVSHHPDN